ncbi:MAG: hypothetical protein ACP5VF_03950 [Acidobacteriota bacterium]
MNLRFLLFSLLLFLPATSILLCSAVISQESLPPAIRSELDQAYPGWQPATVSPDVEELFQAVRPHAQRWLIQGDFTGEGHQDVAVQIIVPFEGHEVRVVSAFLQRPGGYKRVELERGQVNPNIYLWLLKRGHRDVQAHTGRLFTFPRDAIGVESTGPSVAYLFEKGSFKRIWLGI